MIPEKDVSRYVMSWIQLGDYEASIDEQKSEANRIVIKKCSLLGCDYTFIDDWSHHWQFHSDLIKPVEPIRVASTIKRYQNDSASEEVDDVIASK